MKCLLFYITEKNENIQDVTFFIYHHYLQLKTPTRYVIEVESTTYNTIVLRKYTTESSEICQTQSTLCGIGK